MWQASLREERRRGEACWGGYPVKEKGLLQARWDDGHLGEAGLYPIHESDGDE